MEHLNKKIFAILFCALAATFVFALQGCYYDNEEELYPSAAGCETENMTFTADVWPVISASCTGCHSGANPSGNISLENYADVAAGAAIGEGNYGSLYGVINHSSGNSPMPKNSSKLSDCTIAKIKAWIDQGALDN